ncbi:MAG: mannose-1-phosphate guanyltransferase [Bacteroidetes bacterium 4572_77]|nr:MAG: mannose-1-phosphate guanyltransferase [Bacteroidetes bacterium 4572_77]
MLTAYIMAGGSGERFWPLSTPEKPKQLLSLFSDKSMIRETVDRILPLISKERIFIGTNIKQAAGIIAELPMLPEENIVVEPAFKDTAAAIGYGALYVSQRINDPTMVVLAADHLIAEQEIFRKIVEIAAREADENNSIVTLGIKPEYPETGYGYIKTTVGNKLGGVYPVEAFLEKPDLEKAAEYVEAGNFLWNSGMFIFKARTIIEEIQLHMTNHYETLMKINREIKSNLTKLELSTATRPYFDEFKKISIDFGVMEKSSRIKVIPSSFGWNDIGSFNAFGDVIEADEHGNVVRNSNLKSVDAKNNIVVSDDCEVGIIGLNNIIVVQTKGKLLVCRRDKVQDIKKLKNSSN